MDNRKSIINNRNLIIILTVLCVVAVLLGVIAVMNATNTMNNQNDEVEVSPVPNNSEYSELYWSGMSDEEYQYAKMTEEYLEAQKEIDILFAQDPIDLDKINEIYDAGIYNAKNAGQFDVANYYVLDRNDRLIALGMKEEALDALLSVEQNMYDYYDSAKYRYCTMVIELAEELGREDIAAEYKALREPVTASFEQTQREINQINDEIDAEVGTDLEEESNMEE